MATLGNQVLESLALTDNCSSEFGLNLAHLKKNSLNIINEINITFDNMVEQINHKRNMLLEHVETLIVEYEQKIKSIENKLNQLENAKHHHIATMKGSNIFQENLNNIEKELLLVKSEAKLPQLNIKYYYSQLKSIEEYDFLYIYTSSFKNEPLDKPLWSSRNSDSSENLSLSEPGPIAYDGSNGDIYLGDSERLIVFSIAGRYLRTMELGNGVRYYKFVIIGEFIYLVNFQTSSSHIYKLSKAKAVILNKVGPFPKDFSGICTSAELYDNIYVSFSSRCSIDSYKQDSLSFDSSIQLNCLDSPTSIALSVISTFSFHTISTFLLDLKLYNNEFYGLFEKNKYPLQIFAQNGIRISVVKLDSDIVINNWYIHFHIDNFGTIYIPFPEENCVSIYSNSGKLLKCMSEGFLKPRGVILSNNGNLLIVDSKIDNYLQLF